MLIFLYKKYLIHPGILSGASGVDITASEQFNDSTKQIPNSIYLAHMNVDSFSWLGTCVSIKSDGVKVVLIGPKLSVLMK